MGLIPSYECGARVTTWNESVKWAESSIDEFLQIQSMAFFAGKSTRKRPSHTIEGRLQNKSISKW